MTTYKPTKESLIELGFRIESSSKGNWWAYKKGPYIEFSSVKCIWKFHMREFRPQSLEDIKTLIRLFTPN